MRGFNTVIFKLITDFKQFKMLEDVDYGALDGTVYRLPKYAPSDLASTPKGVWGPPLYLPPCGWYGPAVFGHDCAYQNTLLVVLSDGQTQKANLTKSKCDLLCLEMLNWLKPKPALEEQLQIQAIFQGVSVGGWHAFKEDRS